MPFHLAYVSAIFFRVANASHATDTQLPFGKHGVHVAGIQTILSKQSKNKQRLSEDASSSAVGLAAADPAAMTVAIPMEIVMSAPQISC